MAPVFKPTSDEFRAECGFLTGSHRTKQLHGELSADQLSHSIHGLSFIQLEMRPGEHIAKYGVRQFSCADSFVNLA